MKKNMLLSVMVTALILSAFTSCANPGRIAPGVSDEVSPSVSDSSPDSASENENFPSDSDLTSFPDPSPFPTVSASESPLDTPVSADNTIPPSDILPSVDTSLSPSDNTSPHEDDPLSHYETSFPENFHPPYANGEAIAVINELWTKLHGIWMLPEDGSYFICHNYNGNTPILQSGWLASSGNEDCYPIDITRNGDYEYTITFLLPEVTEDDYYFAPHEEVIYEEIYNTENLEQGELKIIHSSGNIGIWYHSAENLEEAIDKFISY